MSPIFQYFEFAYTNGEQFWDCSGQLVAKLRRVMPNLRVTASTAEQRNFVDDTTQRELVFGIRLASMSSSAEGDEQFIEVAATFLRELVTTFEIELLTGFGFRYALGQRGATREEAETFLWLMASKEEQETMDAHPETRTTALQREFRTGGLEGILRFALVDLVNNLETPGQTHPHFAAIYELRGTKPIPVREFDAGAFMKNIAVSLQNRIADRIHPSSHEPADPHP